jgi:hypothetical protein
MDHEEARALLRSHLDSYRRRSYDDLVGLRGRPQIAQLHGRSGVTHQVKVEAFWDGHRGGPVRVLGSIDDGGLLAFKPLTDAFILAPDGTFVGE